MCIFVTHCKLQLQYIVKFYWTFLSQCQFMKPLWNGAFFKASGALTFCFLLFLLGLCENLLFQLIFFTKVTKINLLNIQKSTNKIMRTIIEDRIKHDTIWRVFHLLLFSCRAKIDFLSYWSSETCLLVHSDDSLRICFVEEYH